MWRQKRNFLNKLSLLMISCIFFYFVFSQKRTLSRVFCHCQFHVLAKKKYFILISTRNQLFQKKVYYVCIRAVFMLYLRSSSYSMPRNASSPRTRTTAFFSKCKLIPMKYEKNSQKLSKALSFTWWWWFKCLG